LLDPLDAFNAFQDPWWIKSEAGEQISDIALHFLERTLKRE
jgi:hypothetical protein